MSKRANPVTIGLFMIGALVLLVVALAVFGSGGLFGDRSTFISYFDESANGLEVGADVKFKGVPVGRVKGLTIVLDSGGKRFRVPVTYEIDLSQVKSDGDRIVDLGDPDVLRYQINEGLRAQLKLESFVTGLLYVELTIEGDPRPPEPPPRDAPYPVIPTTGSFFASLTDEASELFAGVQEIDIGELNENLMLLLMRANQKLDELDMVAINRSVLETSRAFEEVARSPDIRAAMANMQALLGRLAVVVDSLQPQLAGMNDEMILTLRAMREAATETQGIFSSNYGIGYQMEEALTSLSRVADALELLLMQLEQNPTMLIRGRMPEDD